VNQWDCRGNRSAPTGSNRGRVLFPRAVTAAQRLLYREAVRRLHAVRFGGNGSPISTTVPPALRTRFEPGRDPWLTYFPRPTSLRTLYRATEYTTPPATLNSGPNVLGMAAGREIERAHRGVAAQSLCPPTRSELRGAGGIRLAFHGCFLTTKTTIVVHAAEQLPPPIRLRHASRNLVVHHHEPRHRIYQRPIVLTKSGLCVRSGTFCAPTSMSSAADLRGTSNLLPVQRALQLLRLGAHVWRPWIYREAYPEVGRRNRLPGIVRPDLCLVSLDARRLRLEPGQTESPHVLSANSTVADGFPPGDKKFRRRNS